VILYRVRDVAFSTLVETGWDAAPHAVIPPGCRQSCSNGPCSLGAAGGRDRPWMTVTFGSDKRRACYSTVFISGGISERGLYGRTYAPVDTRRGLAVDTHVAGADGVWERTAFRSEPSDASPVRRSYRYILFPICRILIQHDNRLFDGYMVNLRCLQYIESSDIYRVLPHSGPFR
jgi:hypothetical protein